MNFGQEHRTVEKGNADFARATDIANLLNLNQAIHHPNPMVRGVPDRQHTLEENRSAQSVKKRAVTSAGRDDGGSHRQILRRYRDANMNQRIQMYLRLPKLNLEFDKINRNDSRLGSSIDFKRRVRSFAAQIAMALGSAGGGGGAVP